MGSENKNGGGGGKKIPAELKKTVQRLKEIVDNKSTDSEIYAVLKECNMDPDEAVQRLLSQGTFHEVKSKRERRKEVKEAQESRARCNYSTSESDHGVSVGSELSIGRGGFIQISSSDLGKAPYKRENESVVPSLYFSSSSSSSSTSSATGKTLNEQPSPHCNSFNADNGRQSMGTGGSISSVQPSPGFQPAWLENTTRRVTMADIVRMGRPQNKGSQMSAEIYYVPQDGAAPNSSHYRSKPLHVSAPPQPEMHQDQCSPHPSSMLQMIHQSGASGGQHDFVNESPVIEQLTANGSSVLDASAVNDTEIYSKQSNLYSDKANMFWNCQSDELQVSNRDVASKNINSDCIGSASASGRQLIVNGAGRASHYDDDFPRDVNSCDSFKRTLEHQEGASSGTPLSFPNHCAPSTGDVTMVVSSAAANLQQLSLGNDSVVPPKENKPDLVFPDKLQALAAECPALNFGSYKSNTGSEVLEPPASNPSSSDTENISAAIDGSSAEDLNTRNLGYLGDEQLGLMYDMHRASADARNYYNSPVSLLPEPIKQDIPEASHRQKFISWSSVPDSSFKNIQQSSSALSFVIDPNARNLPPLPSVMQSNSHSISSDLLASTVQSRKGADSAPFFATQSIPSRYNSAVSSMSSPSISMSEVLNSGPFSLPQPSPHILPGVNFSRGPVLPQQQSANLYSQLTLPLEELAKMIGYPDMLQSYPNMVSALQQAYPDRNDFHESLKGTRYNHTQYVTGVGMSSLPLFSAKASDYGHVGSSTTIPGRFPHNLSTASTGTAVGYDDILLPRYNDRKDLSLLQQGNGSATWDYGPGSRTMSTDPSSEYYNLIGQNQQRAGYQQGQQPSQLNQHGQQPSQLYQQGQQPSQLNQQGQQPSQLYGAVGQPYHSRTRITQEHQRQNPSDLAPSRSQGPSSKLFDDIWRHN